MALFDAEAGALWPAPNTALQRGMTSAAIDALRLPPGRDFDFKNGFTARGVGYMPYAGRELYYSLKLHAGVLYAVQFGLRVESVLEQFEAQPQVQREHILFLQQELGEPTQTANGDLQVTYTYRWGSIGAYLDAKGGMSSMYLRWV